MRGRRPRPSRSGADYSGPTGGGSAQLFRGCERRRRIDLRPGRAWDPLRLDGLSGPRRGLGRGDRLDRPTRSDSRRSKRWSELSGGRAPHDRGRPLGDRLRHRRIRSESAGQSQPPTRPGLRSLRRPSGLPEPIGQARRQFDGHFQRRRQEQVRVRRREHRSFEHRQGLDRHCTVALVRLAPRGPRSRARRTRSPAISVVSDTRPSEWRSGNSLSRAARRTRTRVVGNQGDHRCQSNDRLALSSCATHLAPADAGRSDPQPCSGFSTPGQPDGHPTDSASGRSAPLARRVHERRGPTTEYFSAIRRRS